MLKQKGIKIGCVLHPILFFTFFSLCLQQKIIYMKKVLVVVDVQKDFYHPDGALYVKGGEVLPERIAKVIPEFDDVIFTVDWHPYNHCSFIGNKDENGVEGTWPIHCVQYSEGASLPKEFIPFIREELENWVGITIQSKNVISKGEVYLYEEYGADAIKLRTSFPTENCKYAECEVVFCGIALSHCVKETVANFIKHYPEIKCYVWLDGGVSIDDGTTIREFMKENNIEEWKPQE